MAYTSSSVSCSKAHERHSLRVQSQKFLLRQPEGYQRQAGIKNLSLEEKIALDKAESLISGGSRRGPHMQLLIGTELPMAQRGSSNVGSF